MIIYGSNSSHLLTKPIPEITCEACGTAESLRISVFGRYAHIYWIPLLPVGKLGASECSNCRFVSRHNQMPPTLKAEFVALKKQAKTPVWHYAGLAIIALITLSSFVMSGFNSQEDKKLIAAPRVGDLYHVRGEQGNYSLLKVVEVNGNIIMLQANSYQTTNSSNVSELNKPENYDEPPFDLTRFDLEAMLQKEEIVDVERPSL
ncbi:hypothetical protein [Hymenobacter jejuensis]|uniref:Zinc-ribbon domain-containing protein n=1 Tax=Hymenobacter jejuensis TaxID=2502781 RepID=A0A5B8A3U0_9BACT|nr:hypothetical protein [Hymenobacter jejuensis]QDA61293.1 hypothetical protein FHG12_14860 [Hymenobacter jejuensis]